MSHSDARAVMRPHMSSEELCFLKPSVIDLTSLASLLLSLL